MCVIVHVQITQTQHTLVRVKAAAASACSIVRPIHTYKRHVFMDIVLSSKCVSVAQLRSERAKVCGKRWRSSNNCPAVIRPHSFRERDAAAATDAPQAPRQHPGGQGKIREFVVFSRADLLRTCDLCPLFGLFSALGLGWRWRRASQPVALGRVEKRLRRRSVLLIAPGATIFPCQVECQIVCLFSKATLPHMHWSCAQF
jgi:hypothetical protein